MQSLSIVSKEKGILTKHCSKCHVILPITEFRGRKDRKSGLQSHCKECQNKATMAYQKTEKGKAVKKSAKEKYNSSLKCKETTKKYRLSDRGKKVRNKAHKSYIQTERGKVISTLLHRKYRLTPKGKIVADRAIKKYFQTEKGKANMARVGAKRRAAKGILSTLTDNEWVGIKRQFKGRCVYCGEVKPLTMDHIIPLSKGGHHVKENIVPACKTCNSIKNNKTVLLQLLVC